MVAISFRKERNIRASYDGQVLLPNPSALFRCLRKCCCLAACPLKRMRIERQLDSSIRWHLRFAEVSPARLLSNICPADRPMGRKVEPRRNVVLSCGVPQSCYDQSLSGLDDVI